MPMELSMAPLYFLGQDDWHQVQHYLSGHVMPFALMLASHDVISIVKRTTTFLTSRKNSSMTFWSCNRIAIAIGITWCYLCWCHMMPLASVSVSHDAYIITNGTITFLGQDDGSEVQHGFLGHMIPLTLASALCEANITVNSIIAFLRSRWPKWSSTWLYLSCDAISASVSITWCIS